MTRCTRLGFLAGLMLISAACLSGQGSSEPLSISPANVSIAAGSAPIVFTARSRPDAGRVVWSLDGPGRLTAASDSSAVFTPPGDVAVLTSASITAVLASGAQANAHVEIRRPQEGSGPDGSSAPDRGPSMDPIVRITPASATVYAGAGPIEFRAVLSFGTGAVSWSLAGPGSLSFPNPLVARYTPPPQVALDTSAVLTAQLSGPVRSARAEIGVRRAVGNLALTVTIPAGSGLRPNILVTGPGGFTRTVHASQTLDAVVPGTYRVAAGTELVAGTIVTTAYVARVVGSPASVAAGATARIEINYAARQGSGHLWIADWLSLRLRAYSGGQLASPGQVNPAISIDQAGAFGAVLGGDGELWVAADPFTLVKYAAAHLQPGAMPDVRLGMGARGGVLDYVSGLAFDSGGNLWLASHPPPGLDTNRRILKFSASTLRASDPNPIPQVTLRALAPWHPLSLAFDRAGNLWVVDFANDRLVKFSPAQLASDGAPVPTTIIANVSPGNPLSSPVDLAIDSEGNLWVANASDERAGNLAMYSAIQAHAGGNPNPAVRLARPTLSFARGLAFDASGGLWTATPGATARFSRDQLYAGGAPTPQILLQDGSLGAPSALVFNPPPHTVPLYR